MPPSRTKHGTMILSKWYILLPHCSKFLTRFFKTRSAVMSRRFMLSPRSGESRAESRCKICCGVTDSLESGIFAREEAVFECD